MNYRHIYHAGNYVDVIKHILLIYTISYLKQKPKEFCVLDAFAGPGLYSLSSDLHQKTLESQNGIFKLLSYSTTRLPATRLPEIVLKYLNIIAFYNNLNLEDLYNLKNMVYPGSPFIAYNMLRQHDRIIAAELHPEDADLLKFNARRTNIKVHNIDAYQALKAFVPFKETRGLIFIDPPFEVRDEFVKILDAVEISLKRLMNGIIMIWYPIKDEITIAKFYNKLESLCSEYTILEFDMPSISTNLSKFGIIIINSPWKLKSDITPVLNFLVNNVYLGSTFRTILKG